MNSSIICGNAFIERPITQQEWDKAKALLVKAGYQLQELLGTGHFGEVYKFSVVDNEKVTWTNQKGHECAVKVMDLKRQDPRFRLHFLPLELKINTYIEHENICKAYHIFVSGVRVFMAMALCDCDLDQYVRQREYLPEDECKFITAQTLDAIKYLHDIKVAHRDIKPPNILMKNYVPKLCDFGLSYEVEWMPNSKDPRPCDEFCGSRPFLPPEMVERIPYNSYKCDIWSLGCCVFYMIFGQRPFDHTDMDLMLIAQKRQRWSVGQVKNKISEQAWQYMSSLLQPEPALRPNTDAAFKYAWLRDYVHTSPTGEIIVKKIPPPSLLKRGAIGRNPQARPTSQKVPPVADPKISPGTMYTDPVATQLPQATSYPDQSIKRESNSADPQAVGSIKTRAKKTATDRIGNKSAGKTGTIFT